MTIIEALKTNLPMRRKLERHKNSSEGWIHPELVWQQFSWRRGVYVWDNKTPQWALSRQDILADDWEVDNTDHENVRRTN